MRSILLVFIVLFLMSCASSRKNIPTLEEGERTTAERVDLLKPMGYCRESVPCMKMDTANGEIITLKKDKEGPLVLEIDRPAAIDVFIVEAYLTSKFRSKLELIESTAFVIRYKAKRGKLILEVDPTYFRIKKIIKNK